MLRPFHLLTWLFLATAASGQTINVDLNNGSANHYTGPGIAPGDSGTSWNNLDVGGSPISQTITTVVDSSGVTLPGVEVTIASSDGTSNISRYSTDNNTTPNPLLLMRDYTFSGTYDVTVTGLPTGTYEFWFFGHGDANNQAGTVTVDEANGGGSGSTANSLLGRDLINGGDGVSYAYFSGLGVDGGGTFSFQVGDFFNGFQLRRTDEEPPAPDETAAFNVDIGDDAYSGLGVSNDTGTVWNQFPRSEATSMTVTDVLASDGSVLTGVDVTVNTTGPSLKEYGGDSPGNPTPLNLMRDYYYDGDFTVDVSGLVAGNYQLYVFAHGDQANQNSTVTVDPANGGGSGTTAATGDQNRNLYAANAEGSSYLVFPVTVGVSGTLTFTATDKLTGFQLGSQPDIQFTTLPVGAVVADGTSHTLSALAVAPEPVSYQWEMSLDGTNFEEVSGATGESLMLTASPATTGYYQVVASADGDSITSPAVYFGIGSTQPILYAPADGAVGIAIDQPLRLIFSGSPSLGSSGALRIHDASNDAVVATIDRSQFQEYSVDDITLFNAATQVQQGQGFFYLPIAIHGNEAWISPGIGQRLSYGKTYYVTMDSGLFFDSANQAVPAITGPGTWSFSTRDQRPNPPTTTGGATQISVALDGGGDFATLQGALDWIPANNTLPRTVLVEPGTYYETVHIGENRRFVTIVGTGGSRDDVKIFHPSPATSDSRSAGVLRVSSDDVHVRNLTLDCGVYLEQTNPAGDDYPDLPMWPGRINVLYTTADRLVCEDLRILGGQDTAYTNSGTCYFKNCEVWGSVDFIYGSALAVFDDCDIVQVRPSGGPIAAPSTDRSQDHGIVFLHSRFPRATVADGYPHDVSPDSTTFMRPWRKDGATEVINCELDTHISTKAWGEWSGREATCRARELNNTMVGGGAAPTPAQRQTAGAYWLNTVDPDYNPATDDETDSDVAHPGGSGNRQQVIVDAADYTLSALFGGWLPQTGVVLFPDGYGSMATGGEGGAEVTVTNATDLAAYAGSSQPYVIRIAGTIDLTAGFGSEVDVSSNKTIEGTDPAATVIGALTLDDVHNVIIRQLNFSNPDGDGISVHGASNVHVSHCSFTDCADGACDISHGADYVTVSWCRFSYTAAQTSHRYAMILGNSTASNYHATLHHNWFAELCDQRMPSGSFSRAHLYNNYFTSGGNFYCTNVRVNGEFLVENNFYQGVNNPCYKQDGGEMFLSGNSFDSCTGYPGGWDSTAGALTGNDTVFRPPYDYVMDPAADVPALVSASAGNGAVVTPATIALGNLMQIEDGAPKEVSHTTDPDGLAVSVTYEGEATAPSTPGSYEVVATITQAGFSGSATDTLVIEAANSWAAWQIANFTAQEITDGLADPTSNPDFDGLQNLAEYALGANPHGFTPLPQPVLGPDGLSVTFTRPFGLPNVTYGAVSSDDLEIWNPVSLEVTVPGDPETVRAIDPLTSGDPSRRFIKLFFEQP